MVATRMNEATLEKVSALLIDLGYRYTRDGVVSPAWGEFWEAIADGDLVIYKKVAPPS